MNSFVLDNPVKVIVKNGGLADAGKEAKKLGKKALIVTGKNSSKKHGYLDKLTASLEENGIEYVVYPYVSPNPKISEVDEAAELARDDGSDFVIGIGGGSAMDAAKGAAITAKGDLSLWEYVALPEKKAEQINDALPIMLIPTLAATGSEGNPSAVFTNTDTSQKVGMYNPARFFPKVSLVDPELTLTVPPKPTAEGVIDIIMHVLEEYLTDDEECTLQDYFTEGIVLTCMKAGRAVMKNPQDLKARADISASSAISLMGVPCSGRAGMWVVHPIEHAITGLKDEIAHGSGIAAVLPAYLEFLGKEKPKKVIQLAERIFDAPKEESDENKTGICAEGFRTFIKEMGLSPDLSGIGIKQEELEQITDNLLGVSGFPWPGMDRAGFIAFMKTAL